MLIRLPLYYLVDGLVFYAKLFCQLAQAGVPLGVKLAYGAYLLMRHEGVKSVRASGVGLLSILGPHVINVVLMVTNKQMLGAKAQPNIASVKDQFRRFQFSVNRLISHSVDKFRPKREHSRYDQSTISTIVFSAIPKKAFLWVIWPWSRQAVQEIRITVTLYKAHVRSLLRISKRGLDDAQTSRGLFHYTCVFSGWQA
mgnify:CR=1 FL=1